MTNKYHPQESLQLHLLFLILTRTILVFNTTEHSSDKTPRNSHGNKIKYILPDAVHDDMHTISLLLRHNTIVRGRALALCRVTDSGL